VLSLTYPRLAHARSVSSLQRKLEEIQPHAPHFFFLLATLLFVNRLTSNSIVPLQDLLVNNTSFLPTLMSFTVDGPYDSSEMRRECARMLANICAGLAPRVVGSLGIDTVSSWVSGVAHLKDERLRMHAERARQYILPCM
jgi:hypothetical protein